MIRQLVILCFLLGAKTSYSQELSAKHVLQKSILFHDRNNVWNALDVELFYTVSDVNDTNDITLSIINSKGLFIMEGNFDGDDIKLEVDYKGKCEIFVNESDVLLPETLEKHKNRFELNCVGAKMLRNFWLYTIGLPMKLMDPAGILSEELKTTTFNGKDVYSLEIVYNDASWRYFINRHSFALEGYEFELTNNGFSEYFVLQDIVEVNGIKLSKKRSIYLKTKQFQGSAVLNGFNLLKN